MATIPYLVLCVTLVLILTRFTHTKPTTPETPETHETHNAFLFPLPVCRLAPPPLVTSSKQPSQPIRSLHLGHVTIPQRILEMITRLRHYLVYENSSDVFDIELCRIKVKVTVGVQKLSPFTTIQTVRSNFGTR